VETVRRQKRRQGDKETRRRGEVIGRLRGGEEVFGRSAFGAALSSTCPLGSSPCLPFSLSPCLLAAAAPAGAVEVFRPLKLLLEPGGIGVIVRPSESWEGEPVSFTDEEGIVHRLVHVRGPERITGQWWQGRWKVRDYFDVLDAEGRRYWVFRVAQSGRWFLHGIFE
jgi:hypothetical protein